MEKIYWKLAARCENSYTGIKWLSVAIILLYANCTILLSTPVGGDGVAACHKIEEKLIELFNPGKKNESARPVTWLVNCECNEQVDRSKWLMAMVTVGQPSGFGQLSSKLWYRAGGGGGGGIRRRLSWMKPAPRRRQWRSTFVPFTIACCIRKCWLIFFKLSLIAFLFERRFPYLFFLSSILYTFVQPLKGWQSTYFFHHRLRIQ